MAAVRPRRLRRTARTRRKSLGPLSLTGPLQERPTHPGFKLLDFEGAAAAEVYRAAWSTQGTRGYTGVI